MHVALIVDEERLVHEHNTLNRLSIGLIGEGAQLTRIVPETINSDAVDEGEQRVALAAKIQTPMNVLPWMKSQRIERLVEAMEKNTPDILYALGDNAWGLGLELAQALSRPVVIDLWCTAQIKRVPRGRRAAAVGGYIVPTLPMADLLRKRVDPALVCIAPMGVALPKEPREVLQDAESAIAIAVIGRARDVAAYNAMLAGLKRVIRAMPQVHTFIELAGTNEHEIWRALRQMELLKRVSSITDAGRHRSLITRCDLLIMPECNGEIRSLLLEVMAFGIPVLAGADPILDMLADGDSAILINRPEPTPWADQLNRILNHKSLARAIGEAGRNRIASHHRSSDQVNKLIETFQNIIDGGAYPFKTSSN